MIWLNIQSIIWIWCYSTHFLQYFSPLCIILWYIKKITTMMTSQPNVYLWRSFGGCGSPHKVQLWLKIIYIIFCVFNFKSSVNCVFGRTFVYLFRQHCRLSICCYFGWVWQIQNQKQTTIWWWDELACLPTSNRTHFKGGY